MSGPAHNTTGWHIDLFHPETERLVVSITLTPAQAEAIRAIVPSGPGEYPITVFVGEHANG